MYFKERPYKLYQCFFFYETGLPTAGRNWFMVISTTHGTRKTSTGRETLSEIRILSKGYQFILCSVNFTDNSDILFYYFKD